LIQSGNYKFVSKDCSMWLVT